MLQCFVCLDGDAYVVTSRDDQPPNTSAYLELNSKVTQGHVHVLVREEMSSTDMNSLMNCITSCAETNGCGAVVRKFSHDEYFQCILYAGHKGG